MELLRTEEITKRYGDVLANDRINLTVLKGEIHALLGENGAGKSTLMNLLFGLIQPDSGRIFWSGNPVVFRQPGDAIRSGIGMVHQHFNLVPGFSAVENVLLQKTPSWRRPHLDIAGCRRELERLCQQTNLELDLEAPVGGLPIGQQQRVELLKALAAGAKLLILDEPTAVLTPAEVTALFQVMRRLANDGRAVVLITHKLPEIIGGTDRVSVLRGGKLIATYPTQQATPAQLVHDMVGRAVSLDVRRTEAAKQPKNEILLRAQNIAVTRSPREVGLAQVSFEVRAGETFGIAGVEGNGQGALFDVLCGLRKIASGRLERLARPVDFPSSAGWKDRASLGCIPEDRQKEGLLPDRSIAENLILNDYRSPMLSRKGWKRGRVIRDHAIRLIRTFDIRAQSERTIAGTLSGGNQQKTVIARELHSNPRLLIISNPVRGLDIGATEYVYKLLEEQRARGAAIILFSSDLDEIFALCDRATVLYRGTLSDVFTVEPENREAFGRLLSGVPRSGIC